jgi:hypothetical protein
MSLETVAIGAAIVAFLVVTQLGRRPFTLGRALLPLAVIAYVASRFMPAMPVTAPNIISLCIATLAGVVMGLLLLACLRVGRNPNTGTPYTEAGITYLIVWLVLLGVRQLFVYGIQHWFTDAFGAFLVTHHISISVIAPAFILAAGAIFVTRLLGILWRLQRPALEAVARG